LAKGTKLGKMDHTWKYAPYYGKCATLGKLRHTCKVVPHLEKCATLKNVAQLAKFGNLGKMRST